ncbi:MAG: hypothetical protein A3C38_04405 [Planctomycetes bacterium RIFCSPHIGHO2_02_FULL_50_42]|nr:MAG: hypothetical protein A3C38_04405 [Planctomycetes bacterium RIFCSPHIGHO2_02_FULL_50_42]OHB95085.1 MAG: hypothetical protein A3I59_03230 [Planctomycetes bacterium RIFCSPLOWO2_02_FULL_50_16]OHC02375.1 MAG: hypothetical protein A3G17_05735 [Planctomycetes bacterium RIFCSPLOWO2_12_FULL_50_35]HCN20613.1 hypothetical protein [Planctomycetia bacterium]
MIFAQTPAGLTTRWILSVQKRTGDTLLAHPTLTYQGYKMKDEEKTKEVLLEEVESLRRQITELRAIESESKRLKKELHKLSYALEQSPAMIMITDSKGNIEYVNPMFTQLTGYTSEDVIGKNARILKSGETPPEEYERLWKTVTSGDKWRGEFCNRKKNGSLYWEEASILPIKDVEGVITNFLAVKKDVTERRHMEEVLLQAEKLKAMGEMVSGIAHEFNNILAIILGNVQLLEDSYGDHGELTEGLRIIRRVTFDGTETIRRMQEFTKVERTPSRFKPVDLRELIKQVVIFSRPRWKDMAQSKRIAYKIDLEGLRSTPPVLGSPHELREVLINIINNALDAMPTGGHLSFRTWESNDAVFASISDSGTGMSKDVQKRLFDPFFTTKGPEGTGLGMSVAYGIVKRHGGKIDVESREGTGSTITLSFPKAAKTVHPRTSPKPVTVKRAKNYRILVIDDEKEIISFLDKFLSKEGHIVKAVDNGAEAMKLLKSEDFDLILCDLAMSGVSGWDVIDELETFDKRPRVGIITGWTDMPEVLRNKVPNVDFVLNKPIDLHKLARIVQDMLDAR